MLYIIEGKYNDNERFKHLITNLNLDLDKKAFALFLIDIESECENPDEIYECITKLYRRKPLRILFGNSKKLQPHCIDCR